MNLRQQTCCFTGHRDIPKEDMLWLSQRLDEVVRKLIGEGIRFFGTGGALGFDTLAAETVLNLRREFPEIRLILVLPCKDQTRTWKQKDIARYERIRSAADKVVYTSENYEPGCMFKRNRHLVDYSAVCVAYCIKTTGGSAYTLNYARKRGRRIILLHDYSNP